MKLLKITLKNFMSFDELEFDFKDGVTLITGLNKESDRSNGSGKSSIFLGVFWALYGNVPRSVSSTEVVRHGEKVCSVSLSFQHNNKNFIISRNRGGKSKFTAVVDGEILEESEFQTLIPSIERFGIAMHSQNSVRFLQLSDTQKKEILMSMVDFSTEKALEKMKLDMKQLLSGETSLNAKLDLLQEDHKRLSELKFDFTEKEISLINKDEDLPSLIDLRTSYAKLKETVLQPDPSIQLSIDKIQNLLSSLPTDEQIRKTEENNDKMMAKISEINDTPLGKYLECPHCGTSFVPDRGVLEEIREKQIKGFYSLIVPDEQVVKMKEDLRRRHQLKEELSLLKDKQSQFQVSISSISDKLSDIASEGTKIKERIKQFKTNGTEMKRILKSILETTSSLDSVKSQSENLQFAIDTLSPSGVSSYITELVLNQVNDYLYEHIQILFPHISFEFTAQSELKSGKFSTKLGENLIVEGRQASLGSLSGGEFRALSLAVDLAIMKTMESLSGISFETLLFDEPFDGLDASGRVTATKLLQSLSEARSVVLIEHAAEVGSFNQHLFLVTKEGNISSGRYL